MAETFPSIEPVYGVSKKIQPFVTRTRFQDGYEQVIKFGLNINPKVFNLKFENITQSQSDTIETFLDARANDQASFDYQPAREASSMKFVCRKWSKSMDYSNLATINATFEEVFEP